MMLSINKYLPSYQQGPEAVVINFSSVAGITPFHHYPIYGATKSAIISLTRAWGQDKIFQKTKVRVTAICPGITKTPMMATGWNKTLPGLLYKPEGNNSFAKQE